MIDYFIKSKKTKKSLIRKVSIKKKIDWFIVMECVML